MTREKCAAAAKRCNKRHGSMHRRREVRVRRWFYLCLSSGGYGKTIYSSIIHDLKITVENLRGHRQN